MARPPKPTELDESRFSQAFSDLIECVQNFDARSEGGVALFPDGVRYIQFKISVGAPATPIGSLEFVVSGEKPH